VLPGVLDEDGLGIVTDGEPVALRLYAAAGIDAATIWGTVSGGAEAAVEWLPIGDAGTDGWVIFTPAAAWPAGALLFEAGATALDGESLYAAHDAVAGPAAKGESIAQPQESGAAVADLGEGVYEIEAGPFDAPRTVWLPVPSGVDAADAEVVLLLDGEWYAAGAVAGWLATGEVLALEAGGQTWLGIEVLHGGQAAVVSGDTAAALQGASSVATSGDAVVLALLVFALAAGTRLRRRDAHAE